MAIRSGGLPILCAAAVLSPAASSVSAAPALAGASLPGVCVLDFDALKGLQDDHAGFYRDVKAATEAVFHDRGCRLLLSTDTAVMTAPAMNITSDVKARLRAVRSQGREATYASAPPPPTFKDLLGDLPAPKSAADPLLAGACGINIDQALSTSKAGRSAQAGMTAIVSKARAEIDAEGAAIKAEQAAIEADRAHLPADELRARAKALQERAARLVTKATTLQRQFSGAESKAIQALGAALNVELPALAKARQCGLLISEGDFGATPPDHDLTAAVVAALDVRWPEVKLDLTAPAP